MRRRILVAILGVAAGSVLLLAVPLGIAVQRLYRDDEVIKLERNATAAARSFDAGAKPGDPVEFPESGDALAAYERSGRLLGGEGPAQPDAVVSRTLRSGEVSDAQEGDRLVTAVPVLAGERVVGAVRASRSTDGLSDRVRRARLLLCALALGIVAIAAAAALVLSRRLDRLITRERSFSADASHQLRTPLAALRLELESRLLSAGGEDASAQRSIEQVDRLEGTIDTLLAAARDAPSDRAPFDPGELLEEVREAWHGRLAAEGRRLRVSADREAPEPAASRRVVREILEVLINNAVRHGSGAVSLSARASDGRLAIEVSDEGAGIGGDQEAIFDRRSGGGHGIGLSLARSLAEAEGGQLTLTRASPGPTFTLLLRADTARR